MSPFTAFVNTGCAHVTVEQINTLVKKMNTLQSQSSFPGKKPPPWNKPGAGSGSHAKTILVVDDEPQIVDLLTCLLEDEGYRVRCACNGREAMGIIRDDSPELVISDVMMPAVNGLELMRYLERTGDAPTPKMILMSALGKPSAAREVSFLQKPFDVEDMLDMIDGALED